MRGGSNTQRRELHPPVDLFFFFVCVSYERLPIHFLGGVLVHDSRAVKCLTESAYGLSFKTDEELVFFSLSFFPSYSFCAKQTLVLGKGEKQQEEGKKKERAMEKGGLTHAHTHTHINGHQTTGSNAHKEVIIFTFDESSFVFFFCSFSFS